MTSLMRLYLLVLLLAVVSCEGTAVLKNVIVHTDSTTDSTKAGDAHKDERSTDSPFVDALTSEALVDASETLNTPVFQVYDVAVGRAHTCVSTLVDDSFCWGDGALGQTTLPTKKIASLIARQDITCGIDDVFALRCWGSHSSGIKDSPMGSYEAVGIGEKHACALSSTQETIRCWGETSISDGRALTRSGSFQQLAVGATFTCAVSNTTVECWGAGVSGKPSSYALEYISAGTDHACAVHAAGDIPSKGFCWGSNDVGQSNVPSDMLYARVYASDRFSCGILADGAISCWGKIPEFLKQPPLGSYKRLAIGPTHACAVTTNHELICWGSNAYKQIDVPPNIRQFQPK